MFDYTLSQAVLPSVTSQFPNYEAEIFRLTNIEREKQGLSPLAWEEKAYFFSSTRAYEASVLWSHTRPNGEPYYHIFAEYKVIGSSGENLHTVNGVRDLEYIQSQDGFETFTQMAITGWMESPGHRANILCEDWTSMSVAVYYNAELDKLVSVQLFFA
ncbi:MAG: hypothetical protein IJX37_08130 [Oscillospiraceae bacterium]|nr:hypothetical protein [Oscillospiraceae bacterium]